MLFVRTLALFLGLSAGGDATVNANTVAESPNSPAMTVVENESTVYVVGPFYTYAGAVRAADALVDDGFVTKIVYRDGAYYVLFA